ncbi:MAG: phosphoribosylglycinamide formyltransferase [Phycisphaeraceae bacterium]|nr:phosphoribosylglycinamide formyltransferase [Phycisphaeraceae bacterium]
MESHPQQHAPRPGAPGDLPRLAVMISGGGRSLNNLQDRIEDGSLAARIDLVLANRPCSGEERARARGLSTMIIPRGVSAADLAQLWRARGIDLVVLAGYLALLPIPRQYRGRILNIHPALLPRHGGPGMYGRRVHEAVLASGDAQSGCTVHECDDEYDHGRTILQATCPVLAGDTPETLGERVFALECLTYPRAIAMVLDELAGHAGQTPGDHRP